MKIKIDPIALDFIHTATGVARRISPKAVLYWARNGEELAKLLDKKDFELLTQISPDPYLLPAVTESTRKMLWHSKRIFEYFHIDDYAECVPQIQKETEPMHIFSYQINAPLFRSELLEELGGEEMLQGITFQYSQIVALVKRHTDEKNLNQFPQVLDFQQNNHFLLQRPDRTFCLFTIYSKKDFRHKSWKGWICKNLEGKGTHQGVLHIIQNF